MDHRANRELLWLQFAEHLLDGDCIRKFNGPPQTVAEKRLEQFSGQPVLLGAKEDLEFLHIGVAGAAGQGGGGLDRQVLLADPFGLPPTANGIEVLQTKADRIDLAVAGATHWLLLVQLDEVAGAGRLV